MIRLKCIVSLKQYIKPRHYCHFQVPDLNIPDLHDSVQITRIRENLRKRKSHFDVDALVDLYHEACKGDSAAKMHLLREVAKLPNNVTHPKTPVGDESEAQLLYTSETKQDLTNPQKASELASNDLAQLRTNYVSASCGPRTYHLMGGLALLERALVRFTLDRLVNVGNFRHISVPDALPSALIEACGFPTAGKRTQVYRLLNAKRRSYVANSISDLHCLSGTAEMALGGYFSGKLFPSYTLPIRTCAVSRCFRREVPSQEAQLYRVHQFTKVEMFCITEDSQECSDNLFEDLLQIQMGLFKDLDLHFRVLEMPTEELGAPAYRKVDIEAWMPGEKMYGEISSTSHCTDYQSRRLHIKYVSRSGDSCFVHTLNGTGCAVSRIIKAILETHQDENGHVNIPAALHPYMNGVNVLTRQHPPMKMTWIQKFSNS